MSEIDISKVNEVIKIFRDECIKHTRCFDNPVCPFYNREREDCMFNMSDPEGWDLMQEGDSDADG